MRRSKDEYRDAKATAEAAAAWPTMRFVPLKANGLTVDPRHGNLAD